MYSFIHSFISYIALIDSFAFSSSLASSILTASANSASFLWAICHRIQGQQVEKLHWKDHEELYRILKGDDK